MRLIDADAVLVWFAEYWSMQKKLGRPSKQQRGIYMAMRSMVNSRPTEDAVSVIRCKDCVYYRPYSDGRYDCDNMCGMADAYEDGFCSRAERK